MLEHIPNVVQMHVPWIGYDSSGRQTLGWNECCNILLHCAVWDLSGLLATRQNCGGYSDFAYTFDQNRCSQ